MMQPGTAADENNQQIASSDRVRSNDASTYVTMDLAGETIGVEVRYVREILDLVAINRVPSAPSSIEGVVDIRGESIPIVDIGAKLGLMRVENNEETRIIVFEIETENGCKPVGVLADRVRDVTQISSSQFEPIPEMGGLSQHTSLLLGLARHDGLLVFLLNVPATFGVTENEGSRIGGFEFAI